MTWLELDTYVDRNFENPYNRTDYSNLFNNLRFNPLPWMSFSVNSQLPAFAKGFTEVDTICDSPTAGESASERRAPVSEWEPVLRE